MQLFETVKAIILQSKERVFRLANSALLETYWNIGKLIIEEEQAGNAKAEYGKATLKKLAEQLALEFGKGYDESNLRNMRAFYKAFPICDALRHELSWTHYRLLSRLDTSEKRNYYLQSSNIPKLKAPNKSLGAFQYFVSAYRPMGKLVFTSSQSIMRLAPGFASSKYMVNASVTLSFLVTGMSVRKTSFFAS